MWSGWKTYQLNSAERERFGEPSYDEPSGWSRNDLNIFILASVCRYPADVNGPKANYGVMSDTRDSKLDRKRSGIEENQIGNMENKNAIALGTRCLLGIL